MASTPAGPFERCTPESADHRRARRRPDRREDTRRVAGRSPALDTYRSEFRQRILPKYPAAVFASEAGSAARAERRWRRQARHGWLLGKRLVGVRLVAGIASGVAGCWFGVSGSWSRIRHQRAAAGWSSGRGPAAAADRTSWVASKPARVRLLNLSSSSGRNGSAVALGASMASSRRHCRSGLVSAAATRMSSCCWKIRVARPSWGGPVGRRSLGSTWVAARHTCRSAISSAGTESVRLGPPRPALQLRRCGGPGRRARATSCDRALRYGPQSGSAASRWGMPGSHGNGPRVVAWLMSWIRKSMTAA